MSAVLVTGCSGFIGAAVCEALVARGRTVIGFDRRPPAFSGAEWLRRLVFVPGDITDGVALRRLFEDHPIAQVVHAAAITPDVALERAAPEIIMEVNIAGACRLMAAARDGGAGRLLFLSSISAYGAAQTNVFGRYDEAESVPRPETLYGVSKYAAEQALTRLAALDGMDLRVIRLGPVFGPWEHESGVRAVLSPHHQITKAARQGASCVLPRAVPADWLYSREAGRRIADVLEAPPPGAGPVNLGGGSVTTLAEWCAALEAHHPGFRWRLDAAAPTIRYGYATDRPALDNTRIDALSPARVLPLDEAARDYLAWLDRFVPRNPPLEP
ncbi:NAD-dependent epimerase/dehydratase family protein [Ancylobacter sp. G4_0304]|uniref:NAD-dependent epimerase/dehydratase family protein n=1 Tax=Ancylobacter sp. G4_0304 TaxID=3114289 RepID=UPI0039C6BF3E